MDEADISPTDVFRHQHTKFSANRIPDLFLKMHCK